MSELKTGSPLSILYALGPCRCKLYGTLQEEYPSPVGPDSQIQRDSDNYPVNSSEIILHNEQINSETL